jgi:hypothetical protein
MLLYIVRVTLRHQLTFAINITVTLFDVVCSMYPAALDTYTVSTAPTPEGSRLLRIQCRLRSEADIDEALKKAGLGIQLHELIPDFSCQIDCTASLIGMYICTINA